MHERKLDGYRLQCHVNFGVGALLSRNGLDWSDRFPTLLAAAVELAGSRQVVLDGEVVMNGADEASAFQTLQTALKIGRTAGAVYWVFDLLWYDALDLRPLPLSERRAALLRLFQQRPPRSRLRLMPELRGPVNQMLAAACAAGEEGVMSKRRDAPYRAGRSHSWLKIKCRAQDEFVVVGFTAPRGQRKHIGSLLLASRDIGSRTLRYVGRVGSGFSDHALRNIAASLHVRATMPALLRLTTELPGHVTWVDPDLVVSVTFAEWTSDGLLRQATYAGVREDKSVKDVIRETVNPTPGVTLSHAERVIFPEIGLRKADLGAYYEAVAPLLLPHVAGRPLSLLRCPDGAEKGCFFQKHWPVTRGVKIPTRTVAESDGSADPYAVVMTASDLVALVQMNVVEIHAWGSQFPDIERPDRLVLDFDPGPGVSWSAVCDVAHTAREVLATLGLECWVKLSGGSGLHVTVPFTGALSWEQLTMFSRLLAMHIANRDSRRYTAVMSKSARHKRIFIDWLRNSRGATAVAPWSVRARTGAPIAIPLFWSELDDVPRGDLMSLPDVHEYLGASPTDPWRGMLAVEQSLTVEMVQALGATNR